LRKRRAPKHEAFESVDHFDVVEGISVGGANQKDVLEDPESGQRFIAKLGRRNNDVEVMTEYAIYLVGRSLGVTVADARIARYRGRLRFLSLYFLTKPEELVHGMQLFEELYDESTVKGVLGEPPREQAMFNVQSVKAAFAAHYLQYGEDIEDELFGGFVSMLTHDAFIGVQDRHHENWGVIVRREVPGPPPRFAPLYDSARGLFCNARDPELKRFTGSDGSQRLDGYVARARPLVGFEGLRPAGERGAITHDQLLAAVFRAYPSQRRRILSILDAYDWRRVRADLTRGLGDLCSPIRTTLILNCLRRRLRALRRAINARPG
jgi:hypothetical protein